MLEVDAIILASGSAVRMGTNKLLLPLHDNDNTTLIEHFLKKIPYNLFKEVYLVYSDSKVLDISSPFPIAPCYNDEADIGKSAAIKKGITYSSSKDGILFLVADQPFLLPTTIADIVGTFEKHPNSIIVPQVNNKPRNPVLFPTRFKNNLINLKKDEGGKTIIKTHQNEVHYLLFQSAEQFTDIDTPEMYNKMTTVFKQGLQQ